MDSRLMDVISCFRRILCFQNRNIFNLNGLGYNFKGGQILCKFRNQHGIGAVRQIILRIFTDHALFSANLLLQDRFSGQIVLGLAFLKLYNFQFRLCPYPFHIGWNFHQIVDSR